MNFIAAELRLKLASNLKVAYRERVPILIFEGSYPACFTGFLIPIHSLFKSVVMKQRSLQNMQGSGPRGPRLDTGLLEGH